MKPGDQETSLEAEHSEEAVYTAVRGRVHVSGDETTAGARASLNGQVVQ